MNSAERSQILQMVESGQVSVDEAVGLMSAVPSPRVASFSDAATRWLHIRVSRLDTGQDRVLVNLPLNWVKWGLALGSQFSSELGAVDLDQILAELDENDVGHILEVEDLEDNQRVEIYIE